MKLQNRLVTKQMPWHANMTELNHLGAALLTKPEVFEGKMNQIFTASRYSENPITAMLTGKQEKTISTTEWEWQMRGAEVRPLVILENVEADSNTTPGKFKSIFKIKLDENWYLPGDVIHPGTSDKRLQVRVQSPCVKHGTGFIYEVRGMSDDPQWYLPVKYISAGQQWAKLFSQYGEASQQSGSTVYSGNIAMRSRMSRYRKEYEVTGDAANEVLAVKMMGSNGQMFDSWIKYAEAEYWSQWYRELERGLVYSRSTNTVLDANGRPVYTGPGMQELLEDSNQHFYTHLTASLIEEFLMDIFYSRVKPGKARKIKGFSGEYGMIQFHRAIQSWMEKRKGFITIVDANQSFIQKVASPYTDAGLSAGYQFVRYRMANGAELELVHQPLYDDREINFEIDPVTGYPVESQRITFLDFSGGGDSIDNMWLVNKKDGFKLGYVAGLQNPYGPNNGKLMSHSGDYYEMHVQKQQGLHIEDISRCGELILSRN